MSHSPSKTTVPRVIPLFPLPNVVLFPRMSMPLHVFEPRYRKMVADARQGEGVIGMVLLRPGWESDYHGRPPIYPVGCAGRLEQVEDLPQGRFNLVLKGVSRFRIVEEHAGEPYRLAQVEALADDTTSSDTLDVSRRRVLAAIGKASDGPAVMVTGDDMPHELFVNALSQSLPLAPVERQSLLDCDSVSARYARLLEIMEFRLLEQTWGKSGTPTVH